MRFAPDTARRSPGLPRKVPELGPEAEAPWVPRLPRPVRRGCRHVECRLSAGLRPTGPAPAAHEGPCLGPHGGRLVRTPQCQSSAGGPAALPGPPAALAPDLAPRPRRLADVRLRPAALWRCWGKCSSAAHVPSCLFSGPGGRRNSAPLPPRLSVESDRRQVFSADGARAGRPAAHTCGFQAQGPVSGCWPDSDTFPRGSSGPCGWCWGTGSAVQLAAPRGSSRRRAPVPAANTPRGGVRADRPDFWARAPCAGGAPCAGAWPRPAPCSWQLPVTVTAHNATVLLSRSGQAGA